MYEHCVDERSHRGVLGVLTVLQACSGLIFASYIPEVSGVNGIRSAWEERTRSVGDRSASVG